MLYLSTGFLFSPALLLQRYLVKSLQQISNCASQSHSLPVTQPINQQVSQSVSLQAVHHLVSKSNSQSVSLLACFSPPPSLFLTHRPSCRAVLRHPTVSWDLFNSTPCDVRFQKLTSINTPSKLLSSPFRTSFQPPFFYLLRPVLFVYHGTIFCCVLMM